MGQNADLIEGSNRPGPWHLWPRSPRRAPNDLDLATFETWRSPTKKICANSPHIRCYHVLLVLALPLPLLLILQNSTCSMHPSSSTIIDEIDEME